MKTILISLALVMIFVLGIDTGVRVTESRLDAQWQVKWESEIKKYIKLDEIDFETQFPPSFLLVNKLIAVESNGKIQAVSPVGAIGLIQVMPRTGKYLAREIFGRDIDRDDLFDPTLNVALGASYLLEMTHKLGSLEKGLAAYNCGPTHYKRKACRQYAKKVLGRKGR